MKIGINFMIWGGEITPKDEGTLARIKEWGYDGVEIPLVTESAFNVGWLAKALERVGLECTTSTALPQGASLLDPDQRTKGIDWLIRCIEATAELGGSVCCGPLYSPVGELSGKRRTEEEWASCIEALALLGENARTSGVVLAVEPINRFETYFLNTAADGVKLVEAVNSSHVHLLLDTFHMNIEEKSVTDALIQAMPQIAHIHFSENHRGPIGRGHIDWKSVWQTLVQAGYGEWVVVESFGGHIPELAKAASIWRDLADSPEAFAQESIEVLRSLSEGSI